MVQRAIAVIVVFFSVISHASEPPSDLDPQLAYSQPGVRMTLLAEHHDVVTPTGIDVDESGAVWVVASHTHFRPKGYAGPEHDQVLVIRDGADRLVFYDQTDATMDLELASDFKSSGWVYLAERDRILRVRDSDGDGRGDQEQLIADLKTEADYPHNGLSGLAWHPSGDLLFALGENYWRPWTLSGADGTEITGSGEGGIFRCRPNGEGLRRIARGFWNPFGLCVREDGTMFAAENDPGARPPCRLLHVVTGGDYGYQRSYGNAPYHPFVCWNGQLRGTLPMLHALGEAPCGLAPLANGLIVTSWTDHRLDFYPLSAKGATFRTERLTLVTGGHHFRPTCITQQSPNEFLLTDWVFGSYELHGRGRVWRLEVDPDKASWIDQGELPSPTPEASLAAELRDGGEKYSNESLLQWTRVDDAFLARAALDALSTRTSDYDEADVQSMEAPDQISLLHAIRKSNPGSVKWARFFLRRSDAEVQFESLRWIADEQLPSFVVDIEAMLAKADIDYRLYEACLAAWNTLSGNPQYGIGDADMLIKRITDGGASPQTRAFALRLLDPNHKRFDSTLWQQLYDTQDERVVAELTRAVAARETEMAKEFLLQIAKSEAHSSDIRADAISGLSSVEGETQELLLEFAASEDPTLRNEALRSLRFGELNEGARDELAQISEIYPESRDLVEAALDPASIRKSRPSAENLAAWQQRLGAVDQPADLAAGRRIFHHPRVGTCVKCHRHSGRGSVVGPDLSAASNEGDPDRLLRALLQPSRDVDPQYFPRALVTEDGKVFTGIMLRDGGGGREYYRDANGRERMFRTSEIVERRELRTSMMPDGLIDLMTDREIRDLLAFLNACGSQPCDNL